MASNINAVIVTGNLTRDPELWQTTGGTSVASMRVAVNGQRKDSSGDWVDDPNFFNVSVFGKQAENCAEYLAKGRPVAVSGRLNWREWEDKEGKHREAVDIVAETVQFLPSSRSGDSSSAPPAEPASQSGSGPLDDIKGAAERGQDDIPF